MVRFYLFVYDVVDDKRRENVAKALEAVGTRVQYSVFETYLTKKELEVERKRLLELIDPDEDSIRIYFLCRECLEKVVTMGVGEITSPPKFRII